MFFFKMSRTELRRVLFCLTMFCYYSAYAYLPEGAPCMADGYPGRCLLWRKCFNLVIDIEDNNFPPLCSFDGSEPIICCTSCNITEDVSKVVLNPRGGFLWKTNQTSWNKCIDYFVDLPYEFKEYQKGSFGKMWNSTRNCFEYTTSIVAAAGGRDATRSEFPNMALLGYGRTKSTAQWLCGGSLLNDRFILTAAHCSSRPDVGNVRYAALGMLKRSDPKELWQTHRVRRMIPHPLYHSPSKYHDIALLETWNRISFYKNVLPSCLPNLDEQADDKEAMATGWGTTGPRTQPADTLQAVKLQKFSAMKCSTLYKKHRHMLQGYTHNTQMCYGDPEEIKDTCDGDNGGPLQIYGQVFSLQYTMIGVTSTGPACGYAGQAGMYTRVAPYVPWIDSLIWKTR